MFPVVIEVCKRMTPGHYHVCIKGNTARWTCGTDIETAVFALCRQEDISGNGDMLQVVYLLGVCR